MKLSLTKNISNETNITNQQCQKITEILPNQILSIIIRRKTSLCNIHSN